MKTFEDVAKWCAGAEENFGDPSVPVCQLFFCWQEKFQAVVAGDELVCGMHDGELVLLLGNGLPIFPIPIRNGQPHLTEIGELQEFGAERVTTGVWALSPSLNAQGVIHAFIVLYGVPDPAPWERRIVLA